MLKYYKDPIFYSRYINLGTIIETSGRIKMGEEREPIFFKWHVYLEATTKLERKALVITQFKFNKAEVEDYLKEHYTEYKIINLDWIPIYKYIDE